MKLLVDKLRLAEGPEFELGNLWSPGQLVDVKEQSPHVANQENKVRPFKCGCYVVLLASSRLSVLLKDTVVNLLALLPEIRAHEAVDENVG